MDAAAVVAAAGSRYRNGGGDTGLDLVPPLTALATATARGRCCRCCGEEERRCSNRDPSLSLCVEDVLTPGTNDADNGLPLPLLLFDLLAASCIAAKRLMALACGDDGWPCCLLLY